MFSNSKKSKFHKEQEAKGLISSFTGLKIPFLSDLRIFKEVF